MISNLEKALGFKLEAFNYLYVLCDYETLLKKNISLETFVDLCRKKDVKIIQYRDKISSLEEQKINLSLNIGLRGLSKLTSKVLITPDGKGSDLFI